MAIKLVEIIFKYVKYAETYRLLEVFLGMLVSPRANYLKPPN